MIKSRRIGWAGHVACMGAMRIEYKIIVRKPAGKTQLGKLAEDGVRSSPCAYGNEHSGSIKDRKFLD
jgi:hypothetical protein